MLQATGTPASSIPSSAIADSDEAKLVSDLLLQSRRTLDSPPIYRPAGEDRPITLDNIRIAVKLAASVGMRFFGMFMDGQAWRVLVYLSGQATRSVIPSLKIWAKARLMNCVHASFDGSDIDKFEVLTVATIGLLCTAADKVALNLVRENDARLKNHINTTLERPYLAAQLSLSFTALSSPMITDAMYEGGILAGATRRITYGSNGARLHGRTEQPFAHLDRAMTIFSTIIDCACQLYLLYITLSSAAITGAKSVGLVSLFPLVISLLPMTLRAVLKALRPRRAPMAGPKPPKRASPIDAREFGRLAGEYKQEALLYDLKDWVLGRWDNERKRRDKHRLGSRSGGRAYDWVQVNLDAAIENGIYILLALRILPSNLTLGSMKLYEDVVDTLRHSTQTINRKLLPRFQLIFHIAAYLEAIDIPNHPKFLHPISIPGEKLLDYDEHRSDGAGLVAINLSFRYPGSTTDVLRNINLTIPPGSTLAIIGVNAAGKSTLLKVLIGMFEHQGSLLLNGHPMGAFDPASVHQRTSCLFQDFRKYSFTLRENVGLGDTRKMMDDGAIEMAVNRGGADDVLERVGMEGELNRVRVPKPEWESATRTSAPTAEIRRVWRLGGLGGWDCRKLGGTNVGGISGGLNAGSITVTMPSLTSKRAAASSLSGGQWQRVALSRAFLRVDESDLVVFDEPSASLDPKSEAALFERIHSLGRREGRRCTTIFVSHRFSTVRRADQIAVMENGTIVECGTHTQLMALDGRYSEMYRLQKAGFDD